MSITYKEKNNRNNYFRFANVMKDGIMKIISQIIRSINHPINQL